MVVLWLCQSLVDTLLNLHPIQLRYLLQVISTLWRCVIRCENEAELDEVTARAVSAVLVDNYEEIMSVPNDLKEEILQDIQKAENAGVKVCRRLVS